MAQKNHYHSLDSLVTVPSPEVSLEGFKDVTAKNVQGIFGVEENKHNAYALKLFLENDDHGAEHVYNVFTKASEIADEVEEKTEANVDRNMLYTMIALHDSGRFHVQAPESGDTEKDTKRKEKKAKRADSKHELYGVAQMKFALAKLKKEGKEIDPEIEKKIAEYVYNHDYMTPQLNGDRFHEPSSIEGQIARLADRISTSAITEIERYWKTGKRMGTTFFKEEIPFSARESFRFSDIGKYIKAGHLDQFMFFMTLLAVKAEDFQNPVLQEIYAAWVPQKREAVERILTLAQEEGYTGEQLEAMKNTISQYAKIYEFDF